MEMGERVGSAARPPGRGAWRGARALSLEAEARPPPVAAAARSRTCAPRASTLISRPIFLPLLSLRRSPSRRPRPRRALLPAGSPAAAVLGVQPGSACSAPTPTRPEWGPLIPNQNHVFQACDPQIHHPPKTHRRGSALGTAQAGALKPGTWSLALLGPNLRFPPKSHLDTHKPGSEPPPFLRNPQADRRTHRI